MLVKCNRADCSHPWCGHKAPHEPYSVQPSRNGNPQCTDNQVICHYHQSSVRCVEELPAETNVDERSYRIGYDQAVRDYQIVMQGLNELARNMDRELSDLRNKKRELCHGHKS